MPLALELAAARLAHLSVAELADGLTDALTLLARRGGARLNRQQTLSAALDWSHELLDGDEQQARRRHREWFASAAAAHDPDRDGPVVGAPSPWFDV
ncbi:MAG TPA: hypothetical protein VKB75_11650, partial [Jatrophihabitans sp.]|nr:hypothetical protein [Jatrophihabitans sp.]